MSARPSLRRRVDRRLVSGVVGGIADWLNAPAGFLRVVLFYASFALPWLVIAYAIATLLLSPRGRDRPGWDNLLGLGRLGVLFVVPGLLVSGEIPLGDTIAATELWVPLTGLALVGLTVLLVSAYPKGPTEEEARSRVLAAAVVALFAAAIGLGMLLAPDLRWDRAVPAGALLAGLALLAGVRLGRWRPLVARALIAAAREALVNAAKHAHGTPISLFGEIEERRVAAYVRDRGPGFDLDAIPEDRRGVRDSIFARMVRHGGHAAVRTAPGGGCEAQLVQERRR